MKSVARRPPSSPATRAHWVHSAQAIWAGSARWHTCYHYAITMVIGRVAAKPAELLFATHFLLAHIRVFGSKVDGSTTLRELRRTMHLRHAADGRPRREVGKTSDLTLIVRNCQILLTYRAGPGPSSASSTLALPQVINGLLILYNSKLRVGKRAGVQCARSVWLFHGQGKGSSGCLRLWAGKK